jgi:protein-tyrosine phosphatase
MPPHSTAPKPEFAILMVCMGNICRSPTAEGVLRHALQRAGLQGRVLVDSAGTHNYHPGSPPDERSQAHALKRGYDLSPLRARRVREADFAHFNLILAMDWDNLALLQGDCPPQYQSKLKRLMEFAPPPAASEVVPDPYHGGAQGFETVLNYIESATNGLLAYLQNRLEAAPTQPTAN